MVAWNFRQSVCTICHQWYQKRYQQVGMWWVPQSQVKVIKLEFLLKCDSSVFFFFNCLSRSDVTAVTLLLDCGGWFGLVTSRSATQKEHLKVLAVWVESHGMGGDYNHYLWDNYARTRVKTTTKTKTGDQDHYVRTLNTLGGGSEGGTETYYPFVGTGWIGADDNHRFLNGHLDCFRRRGRRTQTAFVWWSWSKTTLRPKRRFSLFC